MTWIVSKHAEKRIRQRLGLPRAAVTKFIEEAKQGGICSSDVSGSVKRYLDRFYFNNGPGNRGVIYGNHVFVLNGDVLITVIPLPHKIKQKSVVK